MKNLLKISMLFLAIILVAACGKDDDAATTDRDKFIGNFNVSEVCDGQDDSYVLIITAGTDAADIVIANLYDWGEDLDATFEGNNLTIPSQTKGGDTFAGTGVIVGTTITITFTVNDGSLPSNCVATCVKQ